MIIWTTSFLSLEWERAVLAMEPGKYGYLTLFETTRTMLLYNFSLKVVTLLDFLIRTGLPEKYEQKPPPELRKYLKPDLKSMMEFLTVFPKSSFEWFSQNYDCSEYFKSLPGAKKNCDIFAARYRIRTDIFESNEDTLSKMLDLRRF